MLDLQLVRSQFPALSSGAIFLDNPGGTQVAQQTLNRMTHYLVRTNANHEGAFKTSRESDAIVDASRAAVADFLGAARPDPGQLLELLEQLTHRRRPQVH